MITLTTEQVQQIEEALEDIVRVFKFETGTPVEAIAAIRAARAQEQTENNDWKKASYIRETLNSEQAEQEPVGTVGQLFDDYVLAKSGLDENSLVYLAPVRTKDLTDDEIHKCDRATVTRQDFARAVIAADREKNK